MSDTKYYVPQHLDEPMRFFVWTLDEISVFVVPALLIYWMTNALLIGIVVGLSLFLFLKKIKGDRNLSYVKALMYWYLPNVVHLKATPPSYIRTWIG